MKVLILVNHELTLYNFRQELLEAMIAAGHEVIISMPPGQYEDLFYQIGCRVIHTRISQHGMNPAKDLKLPVIYGKLIRSIVPDVVVTYTIKPNIYGGLAAGLCGIPCISTVTGLGAAFEKGALVRALSLALYRIGTRKTRCLFFQNPAQSELFTKYRIAIGRHRLVSGSGVNLTKHCYEPYPPDGTVKLLFVGRVTGDKGIRELVEAMRSLKCEGQPVELGLLGNVENGYENLVHEAEKQGLLVALGRHDNVHDYITTCHAVVLPSYHEGLANVLLEAQATGRPVIASNIHGCIETFEEGITGFGFEPRNHESLADAIRHFVRLPYNLNMHMGRKGREKMEQDFDRGIVNQTYLNEIAAIGMAQRSFTNGQLV